jgi:ribosomal-protein-alanine N-acetyltransferase
MSSTAIVRAGPFHPAALAAIHATGFPAGEAWSTGMIAGHMSMPGVFGFIDERGGMILGRVAADEAEILTLAVSPAVRRLGIAGALMRVAAGHAHASGAARLFLEVAETNEAALALYAGLGFETTGRRPDYYAHGVDARLLCAALPLGG